MRSLRRFIPSVAGALVAGLVVVSTANADESDNMLWSSWADVFTKSLRDQTATSDQIDWLNESALAYAKSKPSSTAAVPWLAQPLPAVDGVNAKIAGYGGGADHTNGFYGTNGSLSVPLAQQWGLQLDGGAGSDKGIGTVGGAGHLFWRDPSIGLLGIYGSYSHWNGIDTARLGHISADSGQVAAEAEYYWSRWTLSGLAGVQTARLNALSQSFSAPNRFFDLVSASYYVTDDFKLSIGHVYVSDRQGLRVGGEQGFALGGGRMASLFTEGFLGEHGIYSARAGLRIYFGQRDKTLIDRHRQDDPVVEGSLPLNGFVPPLPPLIPFCLSLPIYLTYLCALP